MSTPTHLLANSSAPPVLDFLKVVFTPRNFEPYSIHFYEDPELMGLIVFANALIALAYILIPLALIYLIRRRKDIEFKGIFTLYIAFILFSGLTHLAHILMFWYPIYWFEGILAALTGVISLVAFFALVRGIPFLIKFKSPKQLEELNRALKNEVESRKDAEKEVKKINKELEKTLKKTRRREEELENMNRVMVGRELTMIKLKKKLK